MVRIKICGITRPEDAIAAARAGTDAIGLVFAKSPRRVGIAQARRIVAALPPFVAAVGVFVNARSAEIRRIAGEIGLDHVQLHGDEPPARIETLAPLRVIKALRVRDRTFVEQLHAYAVAGVSAILLDAFSPTARGGSGKRFDWDLLAGALEAGALQRMPPIILAGGLTPQNVASAIRRTRPWGVDVSSGVESAPGIKSPQRISQFISAVRGAGARVPAGKSS